MYKRFPRLILSTTLMLLLVPACATEPGWPETLASIRKQFPEVQQLQTEELAAWLSDRSRPAPMLLDARSPEEFAVSHLSGARLLAPQADPAQVLLTTSKDREIVVYCSVGYRSSAAAGRLQKSGFTRVFNLEGSIFKWANEGRPVYRQGKRVGQVHPYDEQWGLLLKEEYRAKQAGEDKVGNSVRIGADRLFEQPYAGWIRGKRVGLITNQTGVNSDLESTIDLLDQHSEVRLTALFGPEHGIEGQAQAGQKISNRRNIYSLYGDTQAPTAEMLQDVDVLIYDIQDVGARFYTYISTLFKSMEAAARRRVPMIVLDRPNPITGEMVEGPVLEPGFESFVGIFRLPIRYAMTAGELAGYFNTEAGIGCDLRIVPLQGWRRSQWYDQTGLSWVMPSPNMPTLETATVYPGLCLLEGTNLSEGRGTARPFELFGATWLDSRGLSRRLNDLNLDGVYFRPQSFTPTFSKYQKEECQGIQLHVLDRDLFRPVPVLLHILTEVRRLHPGKLEIRDKSFDRLAGNSWIRQALADGLAVEQIVSRWQAELEDFRAKRSKYLLY
ncbi:MAG: exo-beta-N-acetylmuramidase NamZ domain-containing protein [Acidobacteriota bacterium]